MTAQHDTAEPRMYRARTGRQFGAVPGVAVGALFEDRRALSAAGVHRPTMAGISGTPAEGADSIVLSGGYEDDEDEGDLVVYTGHGGNDPETKKQVADQRFERGNLALAKSCIEGLPVRVVRGHREPSPFAPANGYRYDGLYRVERYWTETGRSGFAVWRFRLVRDDPAPAPWAADPPVAASPAPRMPTTVQRLVRNTATVQRLKELHGHACQVCGVVLLTPGGPYAEGAHIRPLGRPHDGPDVPENILVLCPNHHVLFDAGALLISETFELLDGRTKEPHGRLRGAEAHVIGRDYLRYHRALYGAE